MNLAATDLTGRPLAWKHEGEKLVVFRIGEKDFPAPIQLNLGCGYRKFPEYINIDNRNDVMPDLTWDILDGIPLPDNSVEVVRAYDFLEHVPLGKTIGVVEEIYRVLMHEGVFDTFTPSTLGNGAWQDPTHVSFWNKNSWLYYTDAQYRALYNIKADFAVDNLQEVYTDQVNNVIHTVGVFRARKNGDR